MSDTTVTDDMIGHDHTVKLHFAAGERPVEGSIRNHEIEVDDSKTLEYGGEDLAPSAVDYMVLGLIGCQLSALTQCLRKARIESFEVDARAELGDWWRTDVPEDLPGNLVKRVDDIEVYLDVTVPEEYESRARRCLDVYDQGCIVGQSFRAGIDYTPETTLSVASE
ncbi:MAG: OsmC family protein [Salinigranum sp.]